MDVQHATEAAVLTTILHSSFNITAIVHRFWPQKPAPIASLPVKVLEIIFGYYAHEAEGHPGNWVSSFSSQAQDTVNPMILGEVNRQWRQISRSLGLLWSKIYISHPRIEHVELARHWLSLAGSFPLTLAVASTLGKPENDEVVAMGHLLDLFLSYYDTWHIVDFHVSQHFHALFLRVPNYPPPIPVSACLNIDKSFPPTPRDERTVDIIHSSPTLQTVNWGPTCYNATQALEKFPNWTNLTCIVHSQASLENSLTVNDCLTILNACPVLGQLDVRIYPSDDREWLTPLPLPLLHSQLRILSAAASPVLLFRLFDSLTLPALGEIAIQHFQFDHSSPILTTAAPILNLLERSSCSLQELFLHTPSTPESLIVDLISASQLQHIRKIRLPGIKTERTVELLTRKRGNLQSLTTLPHLEHLTFFNHSSFSTLDASITSIKRMLISRVDKDISLSMGSTVPLSLLKYANLYLAELDFWDYRDLEKLGNTGFKILLTPSHRVPTLRGWITQSLRDSYSKVNSLCLQ